MRLRLTRRLRGCAAFVVAWLGVVAVAEAGGAASGVSASVAVASETIRAAYVLNFIRFTEWKRADAKKTECVIGVSANRRLEEELITLAKTQRVRDLPIRVLRVRTASDLAACDAVYLDPEVTVEEEPALTAEEALDVLDGRPVLTISSSPGFLAEGGIINLYRDGNNLRFEIAIDHAAAVGLEFSSRLLALARVVRDPVAP